MQKIITWFGLLLWLLFLPNQGLSANTDLPVMLDHQSHWKLSSHVTYLEDSDKQLSYTKLNQLDSAQWQPLNKETASFGFSSSNYWFKVTLKNSTTTLKNTYLHINYPLLDHLDVYVEEDAQLIQHYETGDQYPFEQRPVEVATFLFPLTLQAGAQQTVYIKVDTQSSVKLPLSLWETETFHLKQQEELILSSAFIGALIIMSFYNLFLFFSVREPSYLFYFSFTLSIAGFFLSMYGLSYQWLWPNSVGWNNISGLFFNGLGTASLCVFTYNFFSLKQYPVLRRLTELLIILSMLIIAAIFVLPYLLAAKLHGISIIIIALAVLGIGLTLIKYQIKVARFFVMAWTAFLLGVTVNSLSLLGIITANTISSHSGLAGASAGVLLLSLALADRINEERREKEKAQNLAINNLEKYYQLYENAIEGIFVLTLQGKIIRANPTMLKLLGFDSFQEMKENIRHFSQVTKLDNDFSLITEALNNSSALINHETILVNRKNEEHWVSINAKLNTQKEEPYIEASLIDISARKATEKRLEFLAEHDPLTELYNRRKFEKELLSAIKSARQNDETYSVLYIDLDQFKLINDTCGHNAGDKLLKNLTKYLLTKLNPDDLIARLGGDEFGVLVNGPEEYALQIAETLRAAVRDYSFFWQQKKFTLGISIGLLEIRCQYGTVEQVMAIADTACLMAKDEGRNRIRVFTENDTDIQSRQIEAQWVTRINDAFENQHFFLAYQKIASNKMKSEKEHYEILVRMKTLSGEIFGPASFLPATERYNLSTNLDQWVINNYFSWLSKNHEHQRDLSLASINLSAKSVSQKSFAQYLLQAFNKYEIPPSKICFEITESMAITNMENTLEFIDQFKAMGCSFALDDFGTGFSSYAYIKDFAIDYIKIDGIFVRNITTDKLNRALVQSVHEIAKTMGISTIAEFVESEEIQQELKEIGIDYSQGFHIHKPARLFS
ncbi:EAL domain-containing protein [Pleionea sp. CnH1-48]|uniref:EAL domain-containing protein n=1 Tax=Pleionea sp. CnH1-48 TaxID=2954494 RepID=UPI00209740C8|nr:EAL domain-containing protein [Pleionea sp. CnH1-48]MCO7224541.1 EAL domain-containing protein [Pleionea sp. CnH1-48]